MRFKCERHGLFVSIKSDTVHPMHDDDTVCVSADKVMANLFGPNPAAIDLDASLAPLNWDERAAVDSGLPIDEVQRRWNRTKYMQEVFNSPEPGDFGELFQDSCS